MKFINLHGYEGRYEISDTGVVRGVSRRVPSKNGSTRSVPAKELTPFEDQGGYLYVTLYVDGKAKKEKVHRLVNSSFHRPGLPGEVTRHLDGDPKNNSPSNLAWGSRSENEQDKIRHGRHPKLIKTHCPSGHSLEGLNLRWSTNKTRLCRACGNGGNFKHRAAELISGPDVAQQAAEFYYEMYQSGSVSPVLKQEIVLWIKERF